MGIAAEVRKGYVKHPRKVLLEHMRINFKRKDGPRVMTEARAAELTAISKGRWLAVLEKLPPMPDLS